MIGIKRIYDAPLKSDGYRILIDRLWPRGVSKEHARLYEWAKDITPSTQLRQELHHNADAPHEYEIFKRAYLKELSSNPNAPAFINEMKELLSRGNVTLLTASKNPDVSHVPVLKEFIENKLA
ncbi:MAG: DUF488 family protein [Alphaproteobacteria bacterium]|nr:DUF488 family protein [Alphaproteobacteria bacterium]